MNRDEMARRLPNMPELPELRGSEKQVEWATKLRTNVKTQLGGDYWDLNEKGWERNINHSYIRVLASMVDWEAVKVSALEYARELLANDEAEFWIDNRGLATKGISLFKEQVEESYLDALKNLHAA